MISWQTWRSSAIRWSVLATFLTAILVFVLAIQLGMVQAQSGAKKSDSVVKIQASAKPVDSLGYQWVVLNLVIEDGWHLYANPVGSEIMVPAQTLVSVQNVESFKVVYPKGRLYSENGENFWVYSPQAEIKVLVKRIQGTTQPMDLNVKFQACSHKPGKSSCLYPATVTIKVP